MPPMKPFRIGKQTGPKGIFRTKYGIHFAYSFTQFLQSQIVFMLLC